MSQLVSIHVVGLFGPVLHAMLAWLQREYFAYARLVSSAQPAQYVLKVWSISPLNHPHHHRSDIQHHSIAALPLELDQILCETEEIKVPVYGIYPIVFYHWYS